MPTLVLPNPKLWLPTVPQPYHLEIACEKSTIDDILMPLGEELGINVITGAGELSLTRCVGLVERAKESGLPVRIIYISDLDPGGQGVALAREQSFRERRAIVG